MSAVSLGGCNVGGADVEYTLSESGGYYIVSGVSGDKRGFTSYAVKSYCSGGGNELPVREIGEMAFFRCSSLKEVLIPDTVTVIGKNAFSYCGLVELALPESVTEIRFGAFGGCDGLTEVTVPKSVTVLESRAFAYCANLEKAYVKAEITDLPERAFYNSVASQGGNIYTRTSLKEVYLPATLQKIHVSALAGNAITDIYFAGDEEQWDKLYFYQTVKSDGKEEKVEKSAAINGSVKIHYNVEF